MLTSKRSGCLTAIIVVALCLSLFFNFIFLVGKSAKMQVGSLRGVEKFDEEIAAEAPSGDRKGSTKIAMIYLRGIITGSAPGKLGKTMVDDIKMQLQQAVADDKVKSILLYIDSPGGEVTASDNIYQAVVAARARKPVVVYMGSLAASGGYYIACGGSHLIANETTFTGSIGVITQALQYKPLLEKIGVDVVTFKSGKFKDMLSGSRPLSEEEMNYMQGLIMQTYDKFVGIVARERKQDEKGLREGIADGRVVSGKDALANKLIDATGSVEDAYAKARELGNAPDAVVVRYEAVVNIARVLEMFGQAKAPVGKLELSVTDGLLPKLEVGRLYYLPSILAP